MVSTSEQLSQIELARRLGIVLTERPMVGALTARRIVELGRYPYWDWSGRMTPEITKSWIGRSRQ